MSWPPILIDEDFPVSVARILRQQSSESVEIVVESDRRGLSDADQVAHAARTGAVLVSHNQLERGRFRAFVRQWREQGNPDICVLFLTTRS